MKYVIISIDDGTIYDKKVIEVLNRHKIKGTFNLNSGLNDFVWYKGDRPVRRFILQDNVDVYNGHEVASHSLTHPHLTDLDNDQIAFEVGVDKENLEKTFNRPITSFAFPFHDFEERVLNRIKEINGFSAIRLSIFDKTFKFPEDPYHIKITSLDIHETQELFPKFLEDKDAELYVFVAHSYDIEFDNTYDLLDKFCEMIEKSDAISIYTNELANIMSKRKAS